MVPKLDLIGKTIGSKLVLAHAPSCKSGGNKKLLVRCQCGNEHIVFQCRLLSGSINRCQKCRAMKHGEARRGEKSGAYQSWQLMLSRCRGQIGTAADRDRYKKVGVCTRWGEFENFFADMGDRPAGMTIDRINNDSEYSPENCRWATRKEQARNTSRNVYIEMDGRVLCISEWAELYKVDQHKLRHMVIKRGIQIRAALDRLANAT